MAMAMLGETTSQQSPEEVKMSEKEDRPQMEMSQEETSASPPILRTLDLFRGQREIWIEHDGQHYRLRITRRNKLILQK